MNILRKLYVLLIFCFVSTIVFFFGVNNNKVEALTDDSTLTTTVLEYLSFSLTAGDSVGFGNLTPGTPIAAPATGTIASVTTSASNGYILAVHDGEAGSNSSMTHTDATTKITDFTLGDITTPAAWGAGTGVGITLFAADTNKEAKWGTGTTYDDANNSYAAVPQTATVAHTVTGFHESADTSSWAFKIDVPNTQKTGAYSGTVTFTATAVVS